VFGASSADRRMAGSSIIVSMDASSVRRRTSGLVNPNDYLPAI